MAHPVSRHTGNILAFVILLLLALAASAPLVHWMGWSDHLGCWLAPILTLSQTIAIWTVSIGALLALVPATRSTGMRLIVGGIIIATLPSILSAHLGVFCGRS